MDRSTPTQVIRPNTRLPPRRLSLVRDLRGDDPLPDCSTSPSSRAGVPSQSTFTSSPQRSSRPSWDLLFGTPSPTAFASSPPAAYSPNPSSAKTSAQLPSLIQRRRSTSDTLVVSGATYVCTTTPPALVITENNFKARRHLRDECLSHLWGCDCEKVQLPIMSRDEALQVLAFRYTAVRTHGFWGTPSTPLLPVSTGANAPLERNASDSPPRRANTPHAKDLREYKRIEVSLEQVFEKALPPQRPRSRGYGWWRPASDTRAPGGISSGTEDALERRERATALLRTEERRERVRRTKNISAVFPRHNARSSTPAVLAVPTRVTTKLTLQAAAHASVASRARATIRHGVARDVLSLTHNTRTHTCKLRFPP